MRIWCLSLKLVTMLLVMFTAGAFGLPLFRAAFDRAMLFGPWDGVSLNRVRMDVGRSVGPAASPGRVVDNHDVFAPADASGSPAPWRPYGPKGDAESEPDCATDDDAAPRRSVYHDGIIVRN